MLDAFVLTLPLFLLVLTGYALVRLRVWSSESGAVLLRAVITTAMPATLFLLTSRLGGLPNADLRLPVAFFGASLLVFAAARLLGWRIFGMDGVQQSVFALGGVFSNNLLLGLPMARLLIGDVAVPGVTLVLVLNSLVLLSLASASVAFAQQGRVSAAAMAGTVRGIFRNPLIVAIGLGMLFGSAGGTLPGPVARTLDLLSDMTAPLALVGLGASLATVRIREGMAPAAAITVVKLLLQPLTILLLARAIGLPATETQAGVLLGAIAIGVNVPLFAVQAGALQGVMASALVLSTALSAVTTPMLLWVVFV